MIFLSLMPVLQQSINNKRGNMPNYKVKYRVTFSWVEKEDIARNGEDIFEADSVEDAYEVVENDWVDAIESDWVDCSDLDLVSLSCTDLDIITVKEIED
jgi:hypothetical protein